MPQIRNFADVHKVLSAYVDRKKRTGNYSLDRIKTVMSALGDPQDSYNVIHVAGTSGKTSTCYYLAGLLAAAGQKTGLTVSPHVDEVNERVQINLQPLAEAEFCSQLQKFIKLVSKTGEELTYFELLVAFAYWQFAQQKVDYAVVEVGLGGLLDGTNIIHNPAKICVITDIGLDHTNVLGDTLGLIAAQKAGIIQDHNHVFMYRQNQEVMESVVKRCHQEHAVLHLVSPGRDGVNFKQRNYYLAAKVYDFIAANRSWPELTAEQLQSVAQTNLPARMEIFERQGKTIIIDGSHNGQKMTALVQAIQAAYPNQQPAVLTSFVQSEAKRAPEAFAQLKHLTSKVIITTFTDTQDTPKQSIDVGQLADAARQVGFDEVQIIENPQKAFDKLLNQPQKLLLVTGSFYLLNHIRPLLLKT
ncbi:MAG: bifunctional folylpolyglutamate synthase/dihydrofolate synthase [Candidatus Saccharimonadales bacterium]